MCLLISTAATAESAGEKKRVVVIGGGVAGSVVAKSLQFCADVVLIDEKEYFEIPWGSLRAMVEPSFAERSVINHSDYLPNVRIVASTAANITEREVLTTDGHLLVYEYLVIATGHKEALPKTRAERLSHYEAEFVKINSAKSVLIVGGGPTGVELAGEIATDFPEKKVILVHRGSRLLEFIGLKASQKALDWFISKKVEVILDETINLNTISDPIIQTPSGEIITADCHFVCTGKPTGSSWLRGTIVQNNLDMQGRLMVDENLRVRGHKNIFAVGDITNIKEIKQGYLAQRHAEVTAKNLKLLLMGGNESKMATYKPGLDIALVSLGRNEGVAQFPLLTISGCIPGMIKSGDLYVGKTRKHLGLKP
ncbi:PREDICTED: apoptosis-inducing factor 2-like [Prunus mume]|uniref:Apoptosis-inducing factor 2-like n=1 Tax=Prunus mume TaxID=102107 RepID=A0ABM0NYQ4_PRUMU|nr:PREDICTED: apoptosis-inducing factor 2-like [Prunus mume]